MIYARLAGGLGNQLFQFAASLALRADHGTEVLLSLDGLRRYKVQRNFDLERLLCLPEGCHTDLSTPWRDSVATRLLRLRIGRLLPYYGVDDRNFRKHLARPRGGTRVTSLWLDGYFQQGWSACAFEKARVQLLSLLRPDLPLSRSNDSECVIHVRGSDFLSSEVHQVVGSRFYVDALTELREKVPALRSACVVTDDPVHATPILDELRRCHPDIALSLAPPADAAMGDAWLQDFVLLRDARFRIIGNSTFAWWAAALDKHCAPTISPDHWIRGVPRDLWLPWEYGIPV